jgi:hypothetical protein
VPLVIVIVAEPVPLPVQKPLVVMETCRPELAVAATLKLAPLAAEEGAEVVTVMLWLAFPALTVCVTCGAGL